MKNLLGTEEVKTAYRRYAAVYDRLFGAVFEPGRLATVAAINTAPDQRILEVGVGTGLSLQHYRADASVHGVDISAEMLEKAREKVAMHGLTQVKGLLEMDAEAMSFADDSFDVVVGMYVASVVGDPARMLAEMRRVCVEGGDIVLVNHFASENRLLRGFEKAISPIAGQIGFHPDFEMQTLMDLAGLELVKVQPVNMFGYWRLVHFRNHLVDAAHPQRQIGYSENYKLASSSSPAE